MRLLSKVLFFLAAVFMASSVSAIEFIYPEDGTFVVHSNFLIIKGGDNPPIEGVTIEINGLKSDIIDISSPEYKAVFADFLILEPEFSAGENMIKLEGYAGGKVVRTTAAKIHFQKDPYALPPAGYRPFIMHTPQKEALCAPCHNMAPTAEQLKQPSAEQNPCGSCHRRMLEKKKVHGPAGVFRCTFCHDPSSKPSKYKSTGGDAQTCNQCHLEKVKEFQHNKFVHGPVAVGMCSVCHDAHASDYPAQLHGSINDVCLGCHEKLDVKFHFSQGIGRGHPVAGVADPLSNGRELSCSSCHNPHGGNSSHFFPNGIVSQMMLCQKCHQK